MTTQQTSKTTNNIMDKEYTWLERKMIEEDGEYPARSIGNDEEDIFSSEETNQPPTKIKYDIMESDDEEPERMYYNYGEEDGIIQVAGGGMMNGNAYATVEEISGRGECKKYWYCEYGKNPSSEYIGNVKLDYENGFDIIESDDWELAEEEEVIKILQKENGNLKAECDCLKIENKKLEKINLDLEDYALTAKGLKKLRKVEDDYKTIQLTLSQMSINENEYKQQAIKLICDKANLSKELEDTKKELIKLTSAHISGKTYKERHGRVSP